MNGAVGPGPSRSEPDSRRSAAAVLAKLPLGDVRVDRPAEVARYLEQHPDLVGPVQRAALAAVRQLGDRAQLSLELRSDPEIRDQHLALYVRQSAYDDDLLAVLDQIVEVQGSDPSESSGWFHLTTDFQPPR